MNIYVGNLSLETTADELRTEFVAFGEVLAVRIMNDRYIGSGQTRGYGYVEMALKSAGFAAIANLNGKKLKSRVVEVVEALPLSDKTGISPAVSSRHRISRSRQRRFQTG
ncbi:MAG: RNA-binding protein [Dehalococcoidia bacterium]|jgi:RNA recognition motif-containing protein|nr:MAG: RNA-binding protein [Dehalococcoidia bacterium]